MSTDPFSMHHFLDKRTGIVHRKYSFKRKPCKSLELTSKKAAQLAGYSLIEKDLRSCLAWLDEIDRRHDLGPTDKHEHFFHGKDRANYTIIKGLFGALVTFYAKCFTRCEGRRVKLERKQLDPRFHDMHDHCMMLRHNFAAHSGAERVEHVKIVAAYPTPKRGKLYVKLYRELDQPDMFVTRDGEVSLRQLLGHVQSNVLAKIDELATVIQNEEAPALIAKVLASGNA
jgi:hypothetical protein